MTKRRNKTPIMQIVVMLFSLFVLLAFILVAYRELRPMVVKAVTVEAGEPSINVDEFLLDKDKDGSFITDVNNLNLHTPGNFEIQISINKRVHTSSLEVIDTIAPTAEAVSFIALKDEKLEASEFVDKVSDATYVNISFVSEPDTSSPGEMNVEIKLEDLGNNISIINSKLTILDVKSTVSIEAGTIIDLEPKDFLNNDKCAVKILSDLNLIDVNTPGVHTIQIEVDKKVFNSMIEIVDTTPPSVTPINIESWKGDEVLPVDFIESVSDYSQVRMSFAQVPDFEIPGNQEVTVIIEDFAGNKTEINPMLTIKEDTEPPVFSGVKDKTIYEGESISYKKGVSVVDNRDKEIKFQVDSSTVNLNKAGDYKASYTAEDLAGNKAVEKVTITVIPLTITDEMLNEKTDKILAKITKDGMTKRETALEIFNWIKRNLTYTGTSDKNDWRKEAYRGMVDGLGDCFTYYAVAEALLTRAEIDNMRVTRVGGRTQHFWSLVNCGDGWYHFDSCPNKDKMRAFMLTDAEVEEYTKKRGNNYYVYDKTLYPATPEK